MATQSSSSDPKGPKQLPPDAELQALARLITGRLPYGRINFFIVEPPEGPQQYAVIFQNGSKRATVNMRHRPSEGDAGDIIRGWQGWAGSPDARPLYTTEVPGQGADWI